MRRGLCERASVIRPPDEDRNTDGNTDTNRNTEKNTDTNTNTTNAL